MKKPSQKKENQFLNIVLNVLLPSIILMKGGAYLSPVWTFVVALSFPIIYGIYDFVIRKKWNFFSVLGFVSVLLTGGIGLMELPAYYIAIKEAAIPLLFGLAVLISTFTPYPLIRTFVYSDTVLDTEKIDAALHQRNKMNVFEKRLQWASYMLAGSFFLSAFLNYLLAKIIVQSPSGTVEFNEELGRMTGLSYPIIAVPSMILMGFILFFLFRTIRQTTGLKMEEIVRQ